MIESCVFAIIQSTSRYVLNGVSMTLKPKSITLVSTDGHRLVFVSHKVDIVGLEEEKRFLIPKKAMIELGKLTAKNAPSVEFATSDSHVFLRVGERLMVSRLLSGDFPNCDSVVPKKNNKRIVVNTALFANAIKLVSVMSYEAADCVRISVEKSKLEIHSVGSGDSGEAKVGLDATCIGGSVNVGFSSKYLLDFLSRVESEEIELRLRDAETQGLFTPKVVSDFSHQYILMPMRL